MTTLGARLVLVQDGEVHIELPFSPHLTQRGLRACPVCRPPASWTTPAAMRR